MANVIPQVTIDTSKVKNTWVQSEVVTNDTYNALNKAVIDLKNSNNLIDSNSILFREAYNSSSKNLNNAIHQGIYSFTSSAVNAPSGVNGGNLLVTNTSKTNQRSSIITQIAFCHNGAVYARTKNASENFTSWNKLAYITDNVYSSTYSGNINQGFANNNVPFPVNDFRDTVLNTPTSGFCTRPFACKFPNNTSYSISGIAFGAGDTHGFLQCAYDTPKAFVGGGGGTGTQNRINWYKQLAFADGTGASGNWNIHVSSADKATQDSQGQQINTTYIKEIDFSNDTLNLTRGDGKKSTVPLNKVSFATNSTYAGNINQGFANNDVPFPATDFRSTVLNAPTAGFCTRPFACKFPDNTSYSISGIAFGAGDTHGFLQCGYNTPKAFVGGGISNNIKWYKQLAFSDGTGASGTWNINISGNASTATKSTQDGQGQQINTTYIKGVTGSNATLTITKGNGTTSSVTVNNVSHATNADTATKATQDSSGNTISSTYLKLSGGQMTGSYITAPSSNVVYLKNGSQDNTDGVGFFVNNSTSSAGIADMSTGELVVKFRCREGSLPDFALGATAQTPSTGDNSTRIATTAFVQSLLTNKFTASKQENGWWKDGNTGMIWQWCTPTAKPGENNFPISFPNKCLQVYATNINRQGISVDNAFAYIIDNSTYYYGTKRSDEDTISNYPGAILAIGY